MALKKYKPTTPSRRHMVTSAFDEITKSTPERSLLRPKKSTGGRNSAGRITTRHKGGGHKRRYRVIDFKRNKNGIPATVSSIEYDPNRSSNIALLFYADGEKRYIIAPADLEVGAKLMSGPDVEPSLGMPFRSRRSRWEPRFTTLSCSPVAVDRLPAPLELALS